MPLRPPTAVIPDDSFVRGATRAAFGLAAAGTLLWLWHVWCVFPSLIWNDVRLAPTVAAMRGIPVFPTATRGVVSTWVYGPVPLVLMAPAALARTAAGALMFAGALNSLAIVAAVAMVCAAWPVTGAGRGSSAGRAGAVVLCLLLWPWLSFMNLQADNAAVAFGLVGSLLVVRARRPLLLWAGALCAVAAVASKQTSGGIALAQIIWLGVVSGPKAAVHHLGRCAVLGLLVAAACTADFGVSGLWYTLVVLPARVPWVTAIHQRLFDLSPHLLVHLGLPAALMLGGRRWFWRKESPLLLPTITWCATLPFGLAAMMKLGGSLNSLQSFLLWLPPVLTTALAGPPEGRGVLYRRLGAGLLAAGLAAARLVPVSSLALTPRIEAYRQADYLSRQLPGTIWYPWNPLITLYSDRRYYDDEDGLFVRFLARQPVTYNQARRHLPPRLCVIALPRGWSSWGLAFRLAPAGASDRDFGLWHLRTWTPEPAAGIPNSVTR